ncbi:MAG: hypothetical protein AB7K53_13190, partial [Burkholderiales bacterium]
FDPALEAAFDKALPLWKKVRETYSDALGDLINLDFSPTRGAPAPPAKPAAPAAPEKPKPDPKAEVAAKAAAAVAAAKARLKQTKR